MESTSRIDRLIQVLGGEEHLPPKLPTLPPPPQIETQQESQVETSANDPSQDRWWTKLPLVHQVSRHSPSQPISPSLRGNDSPSTTELHLDAPAPFGSDYCPFFAVTKFCYKFVGRQWMQPLATAFFDCGKIYKRNWDLYYIWSAHFVTAKPVIFVPEQQVVDLLKAINIAFPEAHVSISEELKKEGLAINFDEFNNPDLRPRFLGRCTSKDQFENLIDEVEMPRSSQQCSQPDDRSLEAFKAKIELANQIAKNKNKANREKRHSEQLVKRGLMAGELLAAQRYLGLAPDKEQSTRPAATPVNMSSLDPEKTPPYAFSSEVIFIAIDVEAYERSPKLITEVGIAILDTRDLKAIAPGAVGKNWQQFIRSRHIRIDERKHLVNSEFVHGCPDRFEFGDSEFVREKFLLQALTASFNPPYGKPGMEWTNEKRHLVLVGHDVSQDIQYLQSIGFNVFNRGNLNESLDTASMFRVHTRDPNSRSLGNLLYEFDLVGWNLHNAGNDATYTLWILLAIAVKAASERRSQAVAERHASILRVRTEAAQEQAMQRVKDDAEGWELSPSES